MNSKLIVALVVIGVLAVTALVLGMMWMVWGRNRWDWWASQY